LAFLSAQGVTAAPAITAPSATVPPLLNEFQRWMDVHRGVTEQTLRNYRPIILDLLTTCGERPEQLEAKSLRAFILNRAHRHGKGKAKNVVTATRMFVRFLIASRRCRPGLDDAIPTIAMWRLATLPQYLPADDVERIIAACDPSLPLALQRHLSALTKFAQVESRVCGRKRHREAAFYAPVTLCDRRERSTSVAVGLGARDQAIILLMARLGLRGSDIIGLRFTHINWQDATLVVS